MIGAEQLEAVAGARALQDAGTDDAAGAHQADFGGEEVHAAAAPLGAAGRLAEELSRHRARADPFRQGVTVPAMGAEDDIVLAQVGADAGRDRFFPDISVAGTGHQSHLVGAGELLFGPANQNHHAVKRQQLLAAISLCSKSLVSKCLP